MKERSRIDDVIISPDDAKRYLSKINKLRPEDLQVPEPLLLTYGQREFTYGKNLIAGKFVEWYPYKERLAVGKISGTEIAIAHSFVGSPGTVMLLEELISHGANKIVEAGLAGGIDSSLQPGDICIVSQAFSDEGTSRHYHPRTRTFSPGAELTSLLSKSLERNDLPYRTTAVWTTDAVYRETRSKVMKFRGKGASLVNMETSSIFALAKYRRVEAASIQVVSDILLREGWKPAFRHKKVLENRHAIVRIAAETLTKSG
jgi:uridine phosphorylase